ncbi:MAG: anti-sigma factor family protein [Fimbriimonadaceae bacterium]
MKGLLSAYLDRELSGEEMLLLRDHLGDCSDCSLEFEELRRVKSALIQMPVLEPDPELLARMKGQVFANVQPVPVSKRRVAATMGMAAAVLFLMFAIVQWVAVQKQSDQVAEGHFSGAKTAVASDMDRNPVYIPVTLASSPE